MVMGSTYDNVIIEPEKLKIMAEYYDQFVDEFGVDRDNGTVVCHLKEWAELCRQFANDDDCQGVCYYMMSVSDDPWAEYNEDTEEYERYDIIKGNKHWWLFSAHYKEMV
jgi:hypothetical protein